MTFEAGDLVLLIDAKRRRYLITLEPGGIFDYHAGRLAHDIVIGADRGTVVTTTAGARLTALNPRLADFILRMPRGAQVVYPKDLGPMIHWGDIGPGMTVVEAGTGSGALTMALIRAVGPTGRVVSVDRRDDHQRHAAKTITRFFGRLPPQLELVAGAVEEVLGAHNPDRVMLDVPEPWMVAGPAAAAMVPGGVLTSYLPTVPQVQELREGLRRAGYDDLHTFEVLLRDWAADGRSVRPAHQMIGHTGFITTARLMSTVSKKAANESEAPEGLA